MCYYPIFAIILLLVTAGSALDGISALRNAENVMHQLYGVGMLIIATTSFVGVILCTIASRVGSGQAAILNALNGIRDDATARSKTADGVTTERWETLCASLDKLEGATKKNKPLSNVGEEFDPTPDYGPSLLATELKVKCPKCDKTVKAKPDWAGRRGKCPGCGSPIQFPEARTAFEGIL